VRPDVAVVGAGPAGCATALAFADAGAETIVLESAAPATRRLAGEWLHPAGVRALERLGVDLPELRRCRAGGFIVHPEDGSAPITLPYPQGEFGLSCHHESLVRGLRAALTRRPGATLVPRARIIDIAGGSLVYASGHGPAVACSPARWLVGAEGKASPVRRSLGISSRLTPLSHMAGILLEGAELPEEGYGHILMGGPGPVLMYRIGPAAIRACIDVPRRGFTPGRARDYLWEAYAPWFPASLRTAFAAALDGGEVSWAATQFRPRDHYGRGRVALVGDAIGCFHPLTAVGMTLAMTDGESLPHARDIRAYTRERTKATQVAEMLSMALYRAFTHHDPATTALRYAVYDMWRRSARERERTMNLLAAEETSVRQFGAAFLHAVGLAAVTPVPRAVEHGTHPDGQTGDADGLLRGAGGWLSWLAATAGHTAQRTALGYRGW
jgi:2-polyprenyl-6-methoxyphenol hydroxylase-like FAD-dependent oxidoreductase